MVINKRVSLLLALFFVILLSLGCTRKEDVCDKAVKIACEQVRSSFDQSMCNEAKKYAEAARQNDSMYAKQLGLEFCNGLVTRYEALIELEKAKKILGK